MRFHGRLLEAARFAPLAALLATAGALSAQTSPAPTSAAGSPAAPSSPAQSPPARTAAQAAPAVRLTGVVYAQFEYWPSDSLGHTNQFDVTRAYLNVLGSFGHGVSTRVTGDVYRPASSASLQYRLKYAYVQWVPGPAASVGFRFGMTQTPWIDWQETLYGFRMQGTVPMERAGYLTSSDLGLAMDFSTAGKAVNGSVAVVNGEGYGNPPGGKFLDYEARASVRLLPSDDPGVAGGLRLSGYAHYGRVDAFGGPLRDRWIAELSYKSKLLALAGEAGFAKTGTAPSATVPSPATARGRVLAAFGVLNLPGTPVQLLARVDRFDPNTDVDLDASTRYIGGVAYRVSPNLRLLADVDAVDYQATTLPAALQAQKTRLLFQGEFVF